MSMCHKAFAFDWVGFERDLASVLFASLVSNDSTALYGFVDSNIAACANPYDGEQLPANWRKQLETKTPQEAADFALTAFYDPAADFGLQEHWLSLHEDLPEQAQAALLGTPFGPPSQLFDPGFSGAYFQRPEAVVRSLEALSAVNVPAIARLAGVFRTLVSTGQGVYVTF
jgi:hypothetical protein